MLPTKLVSLAFSGYYPFSQLLFFPDGSHAHAGGLGEMALLSGSSQWLLLREQHFSGPLAEMGSQAGDFRVYLMGEVACEFLLGL